jgi:hypothetical protein
MVERIFESLGSGELVRQLRATAEDLRIGQEQTRYRPRGVPVDLGELCRRGNASYELAGVLSEILRTLARDAGAASKLARPA